ncbi:MAG: FAD-binding oxidoreductase [Gammaproteobacteria bacterium]
MTALSSQNLAELKALAGPGGFVEDQTELQPSLTEWRGLFRGAAPLMLLPDSTAAVAAILGFCHQHRIAVVPQGGNTGLVGGAIPHSTADRPEILLSARRLNRIRAIDAANYSITAEAGCVLASLQAAAADAGRLFPLSLAAEGSCQLGGNLPPMPGVRLFCVSAPCVSWCWGSKSCCRMAGYSTGCAACARTTPAMT